MNITRKMLMKLKLPSNIKVKVGNALCNPIIGKLLLFFTNEINSRGLIINVNNNSIPLNHVASLFWGLYESTEIRYIQKYMRDDLDVIELGSSIGVLSSAVVKKQHESKKIVCVEANPNLIQSISNNIKLNSKHHKAYSVLNKAIDYSKNRIVKFSLDNFNLGSKIDELGSLDIEAITLSDLISSHDINEYVLVSDIEGSEIGIILCDSNALAQCLQIIIELHDVTYEGRFYTPEEISSIIQVNHKFNLIDRYNNVFFFTKHLEQVK